jgi:hypothetical protein
MFVCYQNISTSRKEATFAKYVQYVHEVRGHSVYLFAIYGNINHKINLTVLFTISLFSYLSQNTVSTIFYNDVLKLEYSREALYIQVETNLSGRKIIILQNHYLDHV